MKVTKTHTCRHSDTYPHVHTRMPWLPLLTCPEVTTWPLHARCPGPAPGSPPCPHPACLLVLQAEPLYIMLTVEYIRAAVLPTSPCQNSPQPSDQDKLNTILAVSIFIPFYKCGRMGGEPCRRDGRASPGRSLSLLLSAPRLLLLLSRLW